MISLRRVLHTIGLPSSIAMLAIACGQSDGAAPAPVEAAPAEPVASIASLVTIDQISINQGAKVTLVEGGVAVAPKAPVIQTRPALVRVHAKLALNPKVKKLPPMGAELRIHTPGRDDVVLIHGPRTLIRFDEKDLESTFTFELTGDQITKDATLSVEIRNECHPTATTPDCDRTRVRFPAADQPALSLNVGALVPKLKVTFVPARYGADGSGRMPPLEPKVVEAYRKALYKMYPVSEVELTVREAIDWPLLVEPDGKGWDALLAAVTKTRQDDKVADDVYYVGIFVPAETEREYCGKGSCILGVAPSGNLQITQTRAVGLRVAMVVGYPSERAHGTLAQELAHAMGRLHAPCGTAASLDAKFPHDDGYIGVWGYDVLDKKLIDPEDHADFMSYCNPVWVSDYTWNGIYTNMVDVDATKGGPRSQMQSFHAGPSGEMQAGPKVDVLDDPATKFKSKSKSQLKSKAPLFVPTSAIGGGIWLSP